MRRFLIGLLACTLAAAGLLAWLSNRAGAADLALAGNWKVVVLAGGQEITIWLVKVEQKDGKPTASILGTHSNFKDSTVEAVQADDKRLNLTVKANGIPLVVSAPMPAGEKAPKQLLGSVLVRGQRDFVRMERTDDKELDPAKAVVTTPAREELSKAMRATEDKERATAFKELLQKHPDQPVGYLAAQQLLALEAKAGAEAEAKAHAEQALKIATAHGPEMRRHALHEVARALARSDKLTGLHLDYARQAAQLLVDADSAAVQVPVLKTLRSALQKAGKADEAKALEVRIAKLDTQLDQEFAKDAIPFKPESFTGRKNPSDRVVVLELFTGAQCPPCVAADVAFDALLKTYKPADVALLQYHVHIPGPDPLTNGDTEKRAKFYGVNSAPSIFLNGKAGPPVGGAKQHAQDRYNVLRKQLDEQLETGSQAKLRLAAQRKGDQIDIQAEVSDLKQTGDDVRLRLVLLEDVARYPGRNGQRLHHHIVRALPGGVEGIALKDKTVKHAASVNVNELSKSLSTYLTEYAKKRSFLDDERPLELKHLKVVALVQDNATKEILQAAQVDVPEVK